MIKHASKFFVAAAVTFAVAACGGSDGGPSFTTAVDSATMDELASNAYELVGNTFENVFLGGEPGIPFPFASAGAVDATPTGRAMAYLQRVEKMVALRHPGAIPAAPAGLGLQRSAPFSECNPTITGADELGEPIDSDGDNVPDDYTVNFGSGCVDEDSAGTYRVTISGSYRFQDTGIGLYSFKATMNHLKLVELNLTNGNSFTISVNGSESFNATAALASHSLAWSEGVSATNGGDTFSITLSDDEDSSFDPDAGQSIAIGDPLPDGVFNLDADYRLVGENSGGDIPGNFRMVLSTPTPLHYTMACDGIVAGVFRGLFSGNETVGFTATWAGCGDPTVDLFGYTAATAVAAR